MEFNQYGKVKSEKQIKADLIRNGYCGRCPQQDQAVKCYDIKKKFGVLREKVALTVPGLVYNGICLKCFPQLNPDKDKNRRGKKTQRRQLLQSTQLQLQDKPVSGRRSMMRQGGVRDLQVAHAARETASRPLTASEGQTPVVEYNIFHEPLGQRHEAERRNSTGSIWHQDELDIPENPQCELDNPLDRQLDKHSDGHSGNYENLNLSSNLENSNLNSNFNWNADNGVSSGLKRSNSTGSNMGFLPDNLAQHNYHMHHSNANPNPYSNDSSNPYSNSYTNSSPSPTDELARIIASATHSANPQAPPRPFVPPRLGQPMPSNAELVLPSSDKSYVSAITLDTCFASDDRTVSSAISNDASLTNTTNAKNVAPPSAFDNAEHRSISSYQTREPPPLPPYQEFMTEDLTTLKQLVTGLSHKGQDDTAIEILTEKLVKDNFISLSPPAAIFCLTSLWTLARKSERNKNTILLKDVTLNAIIEAMYIYSEMSSVVQARGCGILWFLSMNARDKIHVIQAEGCEPIVTAVENHQEDEHVQLMAMGAIKVLSSHALGRSHFNRLKTCSVVTNIMSKHETNATIQCDACIIICSLVVDEETQIVQPVEKDTIKSVLNAISKHPETMEVNDVACFTLLRLSALRRNMELMKENPKCQKVLELARKNHPGKVGNCVHLLMMRLGLNLKEEYSCIRI